MRRGSPGQQRGLSYDDCGSHYLWGFSVNSIFRHLVWEERGLKTTARHLILSMTKTTPYKWLVLDVIPYIRFSFYYTSLKGWQYQRGYALLEPGHFILTDDRWKLTSLLIPGEWTHAAFCVAKGCEFEIAEMTHENFCHSTFFDICQQATRVQICDCYDWDAQYKEDMIRRCYDFENIPYDVSFETDDSALYCSEIIGSLDKQNRLQASYDDALGLGIFYLSPTGLSEAKRKRLVWDSANERR